MSNVVSFTSISHPISIGESIKFFFVWFYTYIKSPNREVIKCDVIKIHIKRRIAPRSGKENQPLNII